MPNNPGKHTVNEKCEFVTDIKNRHMTDATVIIDAENKKFVKNRVKAGYGEMMAHIEKTHPEYKEFKAYMKEQFPELYKEFGDTQVKVEEDGTVNV